MSDAPSYADLGAADPTTEAFWQACAEGRLMVQRCQSCGAHQFYPRPHCLACEASTLEWVDTLMGDNPKVLSYMVFFQRLLVWCGGPRNYVKKQALLQHPRIYYRRWGTSLDAGQVHAQT